MHCSIAINRKLVFIKNIIERNAERSTDRIINGFATEGPLPYQLRLDTIFGFKCGATLISSKYAITAKHCVFENWFEDDARPNFDRLEVVAGAYNVFERDNLSIKKIKQAYIGQDRLLDMADCFQSSQS